MATNHRFIPVSPEAVWSVLADPAGYGHWVVGSKHIRDADAGFPAVGTRFHHTIGFGPLTLQDHTEVLESSAPSLLRLRAKGRPFGTATVIMRMKARDGGTTVEMEEYPDGPAIVRMNPLAQIAIKLRNVEALRRLAQLATSRA